MADYNLPTVRSEDNRPEGGSGSDEDQFLTLAQLKDQYHDYLGVKSNEVEESRESDHYYHGAQWTEKEMATLQKRKQPVITVNRIVRKIDAVVGLVERLKQDPKAYSRTPDSDSGAEVATAVIRYCIDHVDWQSKYPRAARMAAIKGLCGVELDLAYGDHQDPDIDVHLVYPDTFFYDPRSYDDNFTDARFMGISKWVDIDQAKELVPDKSDEIDDLVDSGTDLQTISDRDVQWISSSKKKLRMIDHWYISKGKWCWCLHVGTAKLMEGVSPYIDERGKSFSKFLMFSAAVDHDGDRYGFVRHFKGPQDEINARRSKALHILNSRKLLAEKGALDDVDQARFEWARPDGVVEFNPGKKVVPEDQRQDFAGQVQMLQEAKNEIENFGPNPALIGQGIEGSSGRAISLLQQAGIAELGPYMVAVRTWRIRVYRAIWQIVSRYWTAERWIRVTDDEGLAQFIQINGLTNDQYGQPAIANHIGSLDVDIILDEGPDNVNMQADAYDTLLALVRGGQQIPPDVLIELAPLQQSVKDKLLKRLEAQSNDPQQQQAKQIALQGEQAKTGKTQSETIKNMAQAQKLGVDGQVAMANVKLNAFKTAGSLHQAATPKQPRQPASGQPSGGQAAPAPALPPLAAAPQQYGPVPGVVSPSQDMASQLQPMLPFPPGVVPPGAGQV
jgi:hypothetical protein